MSNFMYLFRGGHDAYLKMSQEEKQAHMQVWGAWMEKLREQGALLDGLPLSYEGKVVAKRGEVVTDGPYAEGAEMVGGYLIVNAQGLEQAAELSRGCPIFDYDGAKVEVREIMSMEP